MMNKFTLLIGGLTAATALSFASPGLANSECVAGNGEIKLDNIGSDQVGVMLPFCANMNNGWGNGDQAAPGGSLLVNNAENYCSDPSLCPDGNINNTAISPSNSPDSSL